VCVPVFVCARLYAFLRECVCAYVHACAHTYKCIRIKDLPYVEHVAEPRQDTITQRLIGNIESPRKKCCSTVRKKRDFYGKDQHGRDRAAGTDIYKHVYVHPYHPQADIIALVRQLEFARPNDIESRWLGDPTLKLCNDSVILSSETRLLLELRNKNPRLRRAKIQHESHVMPKSGPCATTTQLEAYRKEATEQHFLNDATDYGAHCLCRFCRCLRSCSSLPPTDRPWPLCGMLLLFARSHRSPLAAPRSSTETLSIMSRARPWACR